MSQDFTLINHEAFAFSGSAEFIDFVLAASHGNGALLKFLLMRYGWIGGPRMLGRFLKLAGRRRLCQRDGLQRRADGLWSLRRAGAPGPRRGQWCAAYWGP